MESTEETHSLVTDNSNNSLEQSKSKYTSSKTNNRSERSSKKSQCYVCGEYVWMLRYHMCVHTGNYPHKCPICQKGLITKQDIRTHMSVHSTEKMYACTMCNKRYKDKSALRQHVYIIHMKKKKTIPCIQCDKLFYLRSQLLIHQTSHNNARKYTCKECDKAFKSIRDVQQHVRRVHTLEGKSHHCKLCGRTYRGTYDQHVKRMHTGDNFVAYQHRHKCMVCEKTFSTPENQKDHMNIHTGLKPYKCTVCGKAYHHINALKNHYYGIHEEKVACEICGKGYSKNFIKAHVLRHSEILRFQCETCGKGFKCLSNIKTHMQSHSKARPFACDICDGTFKLAHHLRAHKKTHK